MLSKVSVFNVYNKCPVFIGPGEKLLTLRPRIAIHCQSGVSDCWRLGQTPRPRGCPRRHPSETTLMVNCYPWLRLRLLTHSLKTQSQTGDVWFTTYQGRACGFMHRQPWTTLTTPQLRGFLWSHVTSLSSRRAYVRARIKRVRPTLWFEAPTHGSPHILLGRSYPIRSVCAGREPVPRQPSKLV